MLFLTEGGKKEEEKEEDKSQTKSIRDRRRPREKRRSTGVPFWTQDVRKKVPKLLTYTCIIQAI